MSRIRNLLQDIVSLIQASLHIVELSQLLSDLLLLLLLELLLSLDFSLGSASLRVDLQHVSTSSALGF